MKFGIKYQATGKETKMNRDQWMIFTPNHQTFSRTSNKLKNGVTRAKNPFRKSF